MLGRGCDVEINMADPAARSCTDECDGRVRGDVSVGESAGERNCAGGWFIVDEGRKKMTRPYCDNLMIPGFIQARGEVYYTEKPHKMLLGAKGKDVVLTKNNMTAPTCTAYHCPVCRKVILARFATSEE
jgi:hypothetical protein